MSPLSCPPPLECAGLTDQQIAQLGADHQAVAAPDVAADLAEAAADTARHLGLDPRAFTVLLTLASRSFSHGFMDGTEHEREVTARTPLALLLNGRTR